MTSWHLARGYRYAGVHSGLRPDPDRRDLALVVSDTPASAAGVFTQNRVCAAPVQVCRERLPSDNVRGIVICSGNANACTGEQGLRDARRMCAVASDVVGCGTDEMLVASTGVIGRLLPMPVIESGIRLAASKLDVGATALDAAAHAILTTDTRIRWPPWLPAKCGSAVPAATGAAMIGTNMATLLAFVLTAAGVPNTHLAWLARRATAGTFTCVSVEGHTSTNDTLLLFANGAAAKLDTAELPMFDAAVTSVCEELARAIAADAEGANHLVTIHVEGTRDDAEAHKVAKAIADSALCKTAIYGADPNWGRFVSSAGYSGVVFAEKDLSLWLGDMPLYKEGVPLPFDAKAASAYLKNNRDITLLLRFTLGQGRCTFWTCDLTQEYIRLNADYTT